MTTHRPSQRRPCAWPWCCATVAGWYYHVLALDLRRSGGPERCYLLARRLESAFTDLQTALRREQAFARDVSHELRTPLTLMRTTGSPSRRLLHERRAISPRPPYAGRIQLTEKAVNIVVSLLLLLAACLPAVALAQVHTLQHKDVKRRYIVYAPPAWHSAPQRALPVVFKFHGGGHTWPGADAFNVGLPIGKTSPSIDANEVMWAFFSRHRAS